MRAARQGRRGGRRRAGGPAAARSTAAAAAAAAAADGLPQGLLVLDRRRRAVVLANPALLAMLRLPAPPPRLPLPLPRLLRAGRAAGGLAAPGPGRRWRDVLAEAAAASAGGGAAPARLALPGGRTAALSARRLPGRGRRGGGWVATLEDVTAREAAEARAERLASHDPLTGLPSRPLLRERLAEALGRARRTGEAAVVLCLDLDQFGAVNETLGRGIGDALLRTAGERLRSVVREADTVARLGGDAFAILQAPHAPAAAAGDQRPAAAAAAAAGALARRVVDLVGRPYALEGQVVNVGASVGVALAPADGDDPDALLKAADLALRRAKEDGRGGFRFYEPAMDARMRARRALELDLRKALALRELELAYQPQLDLGSGRVAGVEALLRWRHPGRGTVPPAEFVPLAEEIGLIAPIGAWVLRAACREAARWQAAAGEGGLAVAVNLSPAQFRGDDLVPAVRAALAASGLPARLLELEITEGVLLRDSEANLATLRRLRALGARVALDDFGTGYASLSYLRRFPFDKIKIDRSFVGELASSPGCAAIVRAIAALGASLGVATTAEGVETAEQLRRVRAEGCVQAQGYLVGRPVPAAEIAALLLARAGPGGAGAAAAAA